MASSGRGWGKLKVPSFLGPNKYMDKLLDDIKSSMYRRGLDQQQLPDVEQGVTLYNGTVRGLANISRHGDVKLEAAKYQLRLTFTLQANYIEAEYLWKKQRLRGKVTASVKRIIIKMDIKQKLPYESPPKLLDFEVMEVEDIQVKMQGLGQPMNWIVRKIICKLIQRHLPDALETNLKPIIEQELNNVEEADLPKFMSKPLGPSSFFL